MMPYIFSLKNSSYEKLISIIHVVIVFKKVSREVISDNKFQEFQEYKYNISPLLSYQYHGSKILRECPYLLKSALSSINVSKYLKPKAL